MDIRVLRDRQQVRSWGFADATRQERPVVRVVRGVSRDSDGHHHQMRYAYSLLDQNRQWFRLGILKGQYSHHHNSRERRYLRRVWHHSVAQHLGWQREELHKGQVIPIAIILRLH